MRRIPPCRARPERPPARRRGHVGVAAAAFQRPCGARRAEGAPHARRTGVAAWRARLRPHWISRSPQFPEDCDMVDEAPRMDEPVTGEASPGEPTQAEIDAWVAAERARRAAWLNGPTPEERAAYANRLRHRRLADTFDES